MKTSMIQKTVLLSCGLFVMGTSFAQRGGGFERREREEHYDRSDRDEHNERFERNEGFEHRNPYEERPRVSTNLSFGTVYGNRLGYYSPSYYGPSYYGRPYSSHYISPRFNIGFQLNVLPGGYWSLYYGGMPYYYYNGAFMRSFNHYYEVVEAPIGAEVPSLPVEARPITIDGYRYYEVNGNFFKKVLRPNGEVWYRVVGKNGRLDTFDDRG